MLFQRQHLKTPSSPERSLYEGMHFISLTVSQDVEQWLALEYINAYWMREIPSILEYRAPQTCCTVLLENQGLASSPDTLPS